MVLHETPVPASRGLNSGDCEGSSGWQRTPGIKTVLVSHISAARLSLAAGARLASLFRNPIGHERDVARQLLGGYGFGGLRDLPAGVEYRENQTCAALLRRSRQAQFEVVEGTDPLPAASAAASRFSPMNGLPAVV